MAYGVRENDEVSFRIEGLALAKKFAAKPGSQKRPATAPSPVHDDYSIPDMSRRVPRRLSQGRVVKPKLLHCFTRMKLEILCDPIALDGRRGLRQAISSKWDENKRAEHQESIPSGVSPRTRPAETPRCYDKIQ
jgi:hypothetical protein